MDLGIFTKIAIWIQTSLNLETNVHLCPLDSLDSYILMQSYLKGFKLGYLSYSFGF